MPVFNKDLNNIERMLARIAVTFLVLWVIMLGIFGAYGWYMAVKSILDDTKQASYSADGYCCVPRNDDLMLKVRMKEVIYG